MSLLIGAIGLGMLLGIAAGASALFAGHPILTALWLYASIGTLSVLVTILAMASVILAMAAVSAFQGRSPEQHSYQK